MSTELTEVTYKDLPAIKEQAGMVHSILNEVMKEDLHYGKIYEKAKPSLWKAGAEKIASMFRISIHPKVEDLSGPNEIRYRVYAVAKSASGLELGVGIGECSTEEEKYKWRRVVNEAEWKATPETLKRIKYGVYKGKDYENKQVRQEPADYANTVLKMAKKRALVDAILTVTAASDIFEQDIEDLPDGFEKGTPAPEPIEEPKKKKPAAKKSKASKTSDTITQEECDKLYSIAKANDWTQQKCIDLLGTYGYDHSEKIKVKDYQTICDILGDPPA